MDFSVLNESSLHNSLKSLYCEKYNGKTEVSADGHIYDILSENNEVIEIQTKNLSKLLPKLQDCLEKGKKVILVHPVPITKRIVLCDSKGNIITERKSSRKGSIYDMFRELTGIYPILLNPDFCLDIITVEISEERIQTEKPVQSKNKKRRYKQNWIKSNKHLDQILETFHFSSNQDYLNLLPFTKDEVFCAKDLEKKLLQIKELPKSASKNANLILWVMYRLNIIELTETIKRSKYYKVKK